MQSASVVENMGVSASRVAPRSWGGILDVGFARRAWWGPSKFVACPLPSCWHGEGPEVRSESPRIRTCLKGLRARFEGFREASCGLVLV